MSEKGDPLEALAALVPWESFRADIEAVVLTLEEAKKSKAGRKPLDAIMMFRMLVLQSLYNVSDEQISKGCSVTLTIAAKLRPAQAWRRAHGRAGERTVSRASRKPGTPGCDVQ